MNGVSMNGWPHEKLEDMFSHLCTTSDSTRRKSNTRNKPEPTIFFAGEFSVQCLARPVVGQIWRQRDNFAAAAGVVVVPAHQTIQGRGECRRLYIGLTVFTQY